MADVEAGVQLPPDTTASALLHSLLVKACGHFDSLRDVDVPESSKAFRSTFGSVLPRFGAARASSKDRSAIARGMTLEAA